MTNRYEGLNKWMWCTMSDRKKDKSYQNPVWSSRNLWCDYENKIYFFNIYNDFKKPRSQRIGIVDMVGKLLYRLCCEKKRLSECALK